MTQAFLRVFQLNDTQLKTQYGVNLERLQQMQSQNLPLDGALLGELGEQARALGLLEASRNFLEKALALAREQQDPVREVANLIRLGTTLQYLEEHDQGEVLMREALDKVHSPETAMYHDFALQHLGKLLVEKGQYHEAKAFFKEALVIRQKKGLEGLIHSTEQALSALLVCEAASIS